MGWFDDQGFAGHQPYEAGGITGGAPANINVPGMQVPAGTPAPAGQNYDPLGAFNYGASGALGAGAAQTGAGGPVGHNDLYNGQSREQWRDAWQGQGQLSPQAADAWLSANGAQQVNGKNGTWMTPHGEMMDLQIGRSGALDRGGNVTAGWGGLGGPAPGGDIPQQIDGGGFVGFSPGGGGGGFNGGGGGGAGGGGSAQGTGWDGTKFTSTDIAAPTAYTPQGTTGPDKLTLGQLSQPGAVSAQQVGPGQQVTPQQVTGPQALSAQQLGNPDPLHNLTADELHADPSYNFRLNQGLGAMQNSAAAKGLLHTGGTLKGLNDYAGESASQEYGAANTRAQQVAQGNITNQANTTGQNNQANAQAYGLTNQYQQQAALANQGANLQSGQFNSGQAQQAALANQGANLQAGQFNAGMDFNTQQGNIQNELAGYNAFQGLNQQNQQFNAARTDTANQQNFTNDFNVQNANNQNRAQAWQGNTNAQLGQGNLSLGFGNLGNAQTQTANSYNLGLGNLALGNKQADQSYDLGKGNLDVSRGSLGLAGSSQAFNQGMQTFNTNYGVYRDNRDTAFNQNLALAGLGANSAQNYGNQAGGYYQNQGAANANAGMAGAGAWGGALNTLGNAAQQAAYWNGMQNR